MLAGRNELSMKIQSPKVFINLFTRNQNENLLENQQLLENQHEIESPEVFINFFTRKSFTFIDCGINISNKNSNIHQILWRDY